ncbi:hypothetical protein KC717_04960 [Candidatus Dojkabacteria bacterium]|uniref:Uncharacterized protein n=1 Tax=Candidatus Dojkabacteria bacterium TaxID=2099670 RepID=A0A955L9F2_9BACT|nr:hypothetical protein [Candidatus Dojkabacteria bacterium]
MDYKNNATTQLLLVFIITCLFSGILYLFKDSNTSEDISQPALSECLITLNANGESAPLSTVESIQIKNVGDDNYTIVERTDLGYSDLLLKDNENHYALNAKYVGYLRKKDGEYIGKVMNYFDEEILFEDLMQVGAIKTFMHLDSTICYTGDESQEVGDEIYVYRVTHNYCTNKCTSDTYELRFISNILGEFHTIGAI